MKFEECELSSQKKSTKNTKVFKPSLLNNDNDFYQNVEESKYESTSKLKEQKTKDYRIVNSIEVKPKANQEDQLTGIIIAMGKLIEKYTGIIDLDKLKNFEGTKSLYVDFEKQILSNDKEEMRLVQKKMDGLIDNIEKIKTHTYYDRSPKENCDICGNPQKFFFHLECMRSHNLDSFPVFCHPCFKLILKSKFYL